MPPNEQPQVPAVVPTTEPQPPQPQTQSEAPPAMPEFTSAMIPNIALSIGAGFAGRKYFGGIGGGLLGVALYSVFLKPFIFPKK
jgi:hypothetical protein